MKTISLNITMKDLIKKSPPYLVILVIILFTYFEGKLFVTKIGDKYSSIEHLLYYYILCTSFLIIIAIYKVKFTNDKIKFIEPKDILIYVPITAIWVTIILFGLSTILKYIYSFN